VTKIVVAYDTTEGQTRKIARHVADVISRSGLDAQAIDLRRPPSGFSLDEFDAIVVGASIHMGKHSRRLLQFVQAHKAQLDARPSAFFSISLSAAGSEKERSDATRYVEELLQQAAWQPTTTATFAGGLLYREYGFLKRWVMKRIARQAGKDTDTSTNHEYTDWDAVDQFVREFLTRLEENWTQERE
jgi:menaquinone-dependent protoporphyrinogen oxidase